MPLASMSKVTSIWGTPRGAGGRPVSWKLPRVRLSLANSRSPCRHVDVHRGLVVGRGGKHLALAGGDGGVALDELGHHPAQGLDAQGKGGDVQKQHVVDLAAQNAALDGRAHGHHLVRVHALVGLLAEELLHHLLHLGDAGGAAHQDHFVDLVGVEARIGQGRACRAPGCAAARCPPRPRTWPAAKLEVQVLGAGGVGGDEGQVDVGLHGGAQLHLGLFRRLFEALQGHGVAGEVHA